MNTTGRLACSVQALDGLQCQIEHTAFGICFHTAHSMVHFGPHARHAVWRLRHREGILRDLLAACYMCFKLLLWIFTASVARNAQVSSITAFSVFYLSFAALMLAAVGIVLPAALQMSGAAFFSHAQEILLALAFLMIIASFVFFVQFAPSKNDAVIDSAKSTSRFETLSKIAESKNLTARELEIALFISSKHCDWALLLRVPPGFLCLS